MRQATLVISVLALLASGCGAQSGAPFAGEDKYNAGTEAAKILQTEESTVGSPLHNRELAVARLDQGRGPHGGEAWIAHLETFENKPLPICIYLWGREALLHQTTTYDVAPCPVTE